MPEMAGEVTAASLWITLGIAAVTISTFCVALTVAARHFPPATIWIASGALVGGVGLLAFAELYLQPLVVQEIDHAYAIFFLASVLGLPSAAAVWVAIRRAHSNRRSILFDSFVVTATFVIVLPVAMVISAVPDVMRLFG